MQSNSTHHRHISLKVGAGMLAAAQVFAGVPMTASAESADGNTATPIKHVIVIIGENRTYDHVFATYKPKPGESVDNLLSKRIINADGTPGPSFYLARQDFALDTHQDRYQVSPYIQYSYNVLPAPLAGGPTNPYIPNLAIAKAVENGLPSDQYYTYLTTGGTGLTAGTPDTRIPNVNSLPPGPFQITPGIPYDAYAASPVHRFYQMWQELDCNVRYATASNPSGCKGDLFPWVETTVGAGANGLPRPKPFTNLTTGEGSTAMGFYNVQQGDAPYLKYLTDTYSSSDNYHQAVNGGTGANHVAIGTGDAIYFSDAAGNAATPPHNQLVAAGSPNAGIVDEIENPDAMPDTNNWYTEDGYGGGSYGSPSYGGGTYSNCSDATAPGVEAVLAYLRTLPRAVNPNCASGHYYLLNNYNPGYFGDGSNAYIDTSKGNTVFTIPPSTLRTIGDELMEKNISFKYYGDQWNIYKNDPYYQNPADIYCNICNFFQYTSSIMTDPVKRAAHLKDTSDLYADISAGQLPAISYVKPSGLVDGHPASSKLDLYEGFVKKIVDGVNSNPQLANNTAIFVTFDEGGGYYDSGYVQPLDFFGDGTRVPLIVVSRFSAAGHISHTYNDHVSLLKFIERNWKLAPITGRSRDNLPNPQQTQQNPYVPTNGPAIGDLFDLFNFGGSDLRR
jgi:phospholipase C